MFIARAVDAKTDERAWRVGARGEEAVGRRLERLREQGWHVLHSMPIGTRGSDIDHMLIGEGGVYTINTKRHPNKRVVVDGDTIRVAGFPQHYVRNSRYEAERVGDILHARLAWAVPVRPVLVFLTGTYFPMVTVKRLPEGVDIADWMDVPSVFKRVERRLTRSQVTDVVEVARWSDTWTSRRRT
jgi:hypothetical protein